MHNSLSGPTPPALGPEFRKLWASSAVSNLGDGVAVIAAPLLAVSLTRDPLLVAGLTFAQRAPWLLFPLISGALVDRLDRRQVLGFTAAFRSALLGLLGLAALADVMSIPLLYAVFFLLGTAETIFDPASVTVLPTIVARENLPRANARLTGTTTVLNGFAGPPIGGFLFAVAAALPFLVGGAAYAAAAVLILSLRGSFQVERDEDARGARLWSEIAEGVRWLAGRRLLRTLTLALGVMNLTMGAWNAILVLYARERLGLDARGYGLLIVGYAGGGIAASVVAPRVVALLGSSRTLRIGLLIETGTSITLALSRDPYAAGVVLTLFGFHAVLWGVVVTSLNQAIVPLGLLGRVNSSYTTIGIGTTALGAPLGGLLAARFGLAAPFWFAACGMSLLTIVVWRLLSGAAFEAEHLAGAHTV